MSAPAVPRDLVDVLGGGLVDALGEKPAWQKRGLCGQTDPEAFFPGKGGSVREAKLVCGRCEVRVDCLDWAMSNDERFGVWGGMSEPERRKMRRKGAR